MLHLPARLSFSLIALGVLLSPRFSEAEEPAAKPKEEGEQKWTALFDGESLKNWKVSEFGGEGAVEVRDGLLVIGQGEPMTGIAWTGKELPKVNYEIQLEAQRVKGTDFFCGLTFPVKENPCSLILGGWGGSLTGLSSIDYQDASENETTDFYDFENGKWYKVRLRVTESRIQAWLGETELADVDYSEKKIGIRLEMELCKPLGLATYVTEGAVKNFRMRPLTEEEIKAAAESE